MPSAKQRKKGGGSGTKESLLPKGGGGGKKNGSGSSTAILFGVTVATLGAGAWYAGFLGPGAEEGTGKAAGVTGGAFGADRCGPSDREHFSDLPARGLHILQMPSGDGGEGSCARGESLQITLHVDGLEADVLDGSPTLEIPCSGTEIGGLWSALCRV